MKGLLSRSHDFVGLVQGLASFFIKSQIVNIFSLQARGSLQLLNSVLIATDKYKQIGLAVFQFNFIYKNRRWARFGHMGHINPCNQCDCDGKPLEGYIDFHFSTFSVKQEARSSSNKGCYIFGETKV